VQVIVPKLEGGGLGTPKFGLNPPKITSP